MNLFDRLVGLYYRKIFSPVYSIVLRSRGVKVGSGVIFMGRPIVTLCQGGHIEIGDNATICSDARYTALGVCHPVILRTLAHGARITIGKRVGMSGNSVCAVTSIEIGDETLLGANAWIADTDFHQIEPSGRRTAPLNTAVTRPVLIGRNVFIGADAKVLKGSVIGENSIVAAGMVVAMQVPSNTIALKADRLRSLS